MENSKTEKKLHYELMYIISNKYTEDEVKEITEKIKKMLDGKGAKVTFVDDWGKRRLAYPINHFWHGYYTIMEFDCATEVVALLDKELRMMIEILRHTVVQKSPESRKKQDETKKRLEKKAARQAEKLATEEANKTKTKTEPKKKVNMKDLDEKLDKILETDDLL